MTRQISRQVFVRGTLGATAGVLLGACGSTTVPGPQTSAAVAGPPRWAGLADELGGRVVQPSSGDYAAAKALFNTRFADSTPAAVVAAKSTDDVRKAVEFAAENGIKVATRSGGHSYIGASAANDAIVIDLRQLPAAIHYDDDRQVVTVPAAATLDAVQTTLAAHGRSIPSGSCPTVGVAGLTLGGGLGSDARSSGLTSDALVSVSVVLPTGEAVSASPDDHPDLFWALRGGGGGNFGVVTSLAFRTFATTDRDVVTLRFAEQAIEQVIIGWRHWLDTADRAIWGMANLTADGSSTTCTVVLATPPGAGAARAADLRAFIGVQPRSTTSQTLHRMAFVHYFEGGAQATRPRAFVAGSDIVGEMTPEAARAVVDAVSAWPREVGAATAVIESLSGAVGDVDPAATAFPWRRQAASIQWYTETPNVESANAWLSSAHAAVQTSSVGSYVNYVEPNIPAARYFGANLARLAAIKDTYDPGGLMYSGLSY